MSKKVTEESLARRIQAVLLDMDGTLVDSDAAIARAWTRWAGANGSSRVVSVDQILGITAPEAVQRLFPEYSATEVEAAAQDALAAQYDDNDDVVATPGARRLLSTLARWMVPWAVVTSADRPLATARLKAAGIVAPLVVTADDVAAGKPDPAGYLMAARGLGVDPRDCLVVEDSEVGLEAGRKAGATTAGLRDNPADLPIGDLGELASLLDTHFGEPAAA